MTPYQFLDAREALQVLPKTSRVVVSWYSKLGGWHFGAGKVIAVKRKGIRLRLWAFGQKSKVLFLKLRDLEFTCGKIPYFVRQPNNDKEAESVAKLESQYLQAKLGWRYTAKVRHAVLSNWRHWAQMRYDKEHHYEQLADWRYRASLRLEEMLRCER